MPLETLRSVLGWCTVINIGLFFLTFVIFWLGQDWIYKYHSRWYKISKERFHEIYYSLMAFYKTAIVFFNLVPYIALRIVG